MRWQGGEQSDNVEDRRGRGGQKLAMGGGAMLLILIASYFLGIDPRKINQLLNPPGAGGPAGNGVERPLTPQELKSKEFAATVLKFTEDVWQEQFRKLNKPYRPTKLVLFSDMVQTDCGAAPSAVGPFYCPADQTVYLDPTFFPELESKLGGSTAEFSQAYVIAHEVGHHVQNLLGYSKAVHDKQRAAADEEANQLSVRLELQADYLAGVWAHYGQQKFNFIEPGDIEAAIKSANAIGDDRLQKNSRGFTSPEKYTHGTSAQRVKWFRQGLQTGDISRLPDFFTMPYRAL
jgi:predicted metalloprotease